MLYCLKKDKISHVVLYLQCELVENVVTCIFWSNVAIVDEWDSIRPEYNERLCVCYKQACRTPGTCEQENLDCP